MNVTIFFNNPVCPKYICFQAYCSKQFAFSNISTSLSPCILNTLRSAHLEERFTARPELDGVAKNPTATSEENGVRFANKLIRISSTPLRNDQRGRFEEFLHFVDHLVLFLFLFVKLLVAKVDAQEPGSAVSVELRRSSKES